MYVYDPRTRTDEGILRLCKEIKEKWSGTMTPPMQYGLNDAWNKINQAEVKQTRGQVDTTAITWTPPDSGHHWIVDTTG